MQRETVWLSTSLFCSKGAWHYVLKQAIGTFLADLSDSGQLSSFRLEFNYLSGENIRFALLCPFHEKEKVAEKTDMMFKNFFTHAKLSSKKYSLPVKGVFIPFPSNTIQYGLYTVPEEAGHLDSYITETLSRCILEALGEEVVDDEIILTFAFYLHNALLHALNLHSSTEFYNVAPENVGEGILSHEAVVEKYNQIRDMLEEIQSDIINRDSLPNWYYNWEVCCLRVIKRMQIPNSKLIHRRISDHINRHLCINVNMQLLLNHFISQTAFRK